MASCSFGMNQPQPQAQPDVMTMLKNVWGLIKEHPYITAALGGGAAFAAYKVATLNLATAKKRKPFAPKGAHQPASNMQLVQGLAFIMQHAQKALELYQEGKMPRAYLHGKYCEIAKQLGFNAMPQAERMSLFNAIVGFDTAFAGYNFQTKQKVGLQVAVPAAIQHLQEVVQQLHAKYKTPNAGEHRVQSTQPAVKAENSGVNGIVQMFMQKLRENPISTIGLILSSGYSLLAQFNGWPPYGPTPVPTQPQAAPTPAAPASAAPGLGVD